MRTSWKGKELLPETAKKLAALSAAHLDASGMAQAARDAHNGKARDLSAVRNNLRIAKEEVAAHRLRADDPELLSLRRRHDALAEEVSELEQAAAARQQRADPIIRLHARATSFLDSCPQEALLQPAPAVAVRLGKNESEPEGVERLRRTVADMRAEIAKVGALPRSMSDIKKHIADEVDALAEEGRPGMSGVVNGFGHVDWPETRTTAGFVHKTLAIMAWLDPAALRARLEAEVAALTSQDGPTAEERAKVVADLDQRCVVAEREEEALLEKMEARGFNVVRRGDMDLRAALALADTAPVSGF